MASKEKEAKKDGTVASVNTDVIENKKDAEALKVEVAPIIYNGMSNQTIKEKLEKIGYEIYKGALCSVKVKQDKDTGKLIKEYTPISNFIPIIAKQIIYKNGKDEIVFYDMEGVTTDTSKRLPGITISSEELKRGAYSDNSEWQCKAILEPVPYADKKIKYVANKMSEHLMQKQETYTNTGFATINGKSVFLYHNGIIGKVEDISVNLSRDGLEQYCFTDKEFDLMEALNLSYSILGVADRKITIPLLAITYLAPFTTMFSNENILTDCTIWIEGKSQTKKSSLSAVLLSHFGQFRRNKFVCSFRDTFNALEKKAFVLKDVLQVVDDFNPETVGNKKLEVAEKLLAMFGDRDGRGRLSANAQDIKKPYVARGVCIVTAEYFPSLAASRRARAVVVEVNQNSIDGPKLREIQDNVEKLSFAMKKFIEWIIDNESTIIVKAKKLQKTLEEQASENQKYPRVYEAVIALTIGFNLFLEFLQENNVITAQELQEKAELCGNVLTELAKDQSKDIEDENPIVMCKEAIEQLYETDKIQIMDYHAPCNILPNHTLLGYIDHKEQQYYFLPNILYKEVTKFYREQGINFPISSKSALLKYLENEGFLYRPPKSDRRTIKKKVPNRNTVLPVVAIYQDKLGIEINKPDDTVFDKVQEQFRESIVRGQKQLEKLKGNVTEIAV